ncbi:MAG: tetratricopeptide repeat protein, partial [Myxococcota bacterium]
MATNKASSEQPESTTDIELTGDETLEELAEKGIDPTLSPAYMAQYESQFSNQDLLQMVNSGAVETEWIEERQSPFNADNFKKFVLGEMTWAQLQGMSMEEAYAFAEIAYKLFEQGKYAAAQTIFEGLVISNPYDGYFHAMLGAIYARKDMHEEAAEEYSIAIELDAENISAYVNRAEILLQHGEFEIAMEDLKAAIKLDPKGEDPSGLRARALAAATAALIEEVLQQKAKEGAKPG